MADYYHEARAAKRALRDVERENKQRKRDVEHIEHPLNYLTINGRGCKIYRCQLGQHAAVERNEGLIPWNGEMDNLIDRFDVRCLLDFYRDPPPSNKVSASQQDQKLQQLLEFERYRDVVQHTAKGLNEVEGVEAAQEENLAIRAQARVVATAAFRIQSHQAMPGDATTAGNGPGMYSAVGFNYGTNEESDSDSSSDSDEEAQHVDDQTAEECAAEAEEDAIDEVAESFGIKDFSYRLHRVLPKEGEEDAARHMPRRRSNRKKTRERARRMAGMGLDPKGQTLRNWNDPLVTNAPSAYLVRPRRPSPGARDSRSRSRSRSPSGRPGAAGFLGSVPAINSSKPIIDRKLFERDDNIIDALPDMPDPANCGPQSFPAASALQNIRQQQELQRKSYSRRRSPSRDRSRSRSRSRSRYRRRSRSSSADRRYRRRYSSPDGYSRRRSRRDSRGSLSRSRSRERFRRRRSRSRDRNRRRRSGSSSSSSRSRSISRSRRGSRSRSHSRSSYRRHGSSRGHSRDKYRRSSRAHHHRGSSPSRSTSGSRSRSRSRSPGTKRPRSEGATNKAKEEAKGVSSGSAPKPGGAGPAAETPAERMKRIMQAQLSKQLQKDSVAATQKKHQAEKEKQARVQLERLTRKNVATRARSPPPFDEFERGELQNRRGYR